MPKRMRITFSSLGESVLRMPAVSSRTLDSITASTGEPTQRSSISSPRADSPWRPTGVSSDTGSREMVFSFWTFSTGMSIRRPISSFVGVRPDRKRGRVLFRSRFAVAAHRGFERHRIAGDGLQLLDFLHRDVHPAANFVICRSAAQFLLQFARCPQELVHAFVHVHRDADGAGLVGDGAGYGLPDPPRGVGRKLVTAAIFELVGGAHEADIAFLDQVQEVKSAVHVFLGNGDDQAEVGLDQVLFGPLGFGFAMTDYGQAVLEFGQRGAGGGFALLDFALQLPQAELLGGVGAHFEALDFAIEMADFIHRAFDFAGKLLPFDEAEGSAADGQGGLHLGAV